jgi:hypothetical protein
MSAFYDLASLVFLPSGYKSGKLYAQKPQTTDGQLAFTRASTATRVNASGLIEAVATGVPRLDYLNSTCPKLLLEPQRSNIMLYSEQFDNAAWTKGDLTVSANNATSPDGFTNADRMVETTATGQHLAFQSLTVANGSTYTFTIFLKAQQRNAVSLQLADDSNRFTTLFDVSAGTILTTRNTGTPVGTSNSIVNYGSGWYRCSITMTQSAGTTMIPHFALSNSNTPTWDGFDFPTYAGNTANGLLAYGAALELGAYATSYIPTTTAAVTRVADAASKTGISSLIGQTEGTVFLELNRIFDANVVVLQLNDGTNNNRIQLEISSGGAILGISVVGGSVNVLITSPVLAINQTHKIAFSYKLNDFKLFLNGVLAGVDTSGAVPASMSRLDIGTEVGNNFAGFKIAQMVNFKTALTSTQLAELTAL